MSRNLRPLPKTFNHQLSSSSCQKCPIIGDQAGRSDNSDIRKNKVFSDAITNNRAINVFNNGEMSRDFTYIDDIVDGVIKVIDNPSKCNVYNIGNNAPLSLMTFIETLENALGKKAEKNFMPMQDGDVVSTYADVSGLINDFGYKPDTDLKDGIEQFVKWYKGFYEKKD